MPAPRKYTDELRERAVRLVFDIRKRQLVRQVREKAPSQ